MEAWQTCPGRSGPCGSLSTALAPHAHTAAAWGGCGGGAMQGAPGVGRGEGGVCVCRGGVLGAPGQGRDVYVCVHEWWRVHSDASVGQVGLGRYDPPAPVPSRQRGPQPWGHGIGQHCLRCPRSSPPHLNPCPCPFLRPPCAPAPSSAHHVPLPLPPPTLRPCPFLRPPLHCHVVGKVPEFRVEGVGAVEQCRSSHTA